MSKCVQVKHAVVAQDKLGADLITLMGFDSGGLPGEADMGIFVQMALVKSNHGWLVFLFFWINYVCYILCTASKAV